MKRSAFGALLLFLLLVPSSLVRSQTTVNALFGDGMVLQRDQTVAIWGTDTPGTRLTVTASWGQTAQTTVDRAGQWKLELATPAAGGPHQVTVTGSAVIALADVWSGEVWLCSGQSNMEMPVKGFLNQPTIGSQAAILDARGDDIRVFEVQRNPSLEPVVDVTGTWVAVNPATVGDVSAVAYFFGRRLARTLGVPVGLIVSSWGGSSAEAWTDAPTLRRLGDFTAPTVVSERAPQQTPTVLFNGMIQPVVGYGLRGAIWYQGEANVSRAGRYAELMTAMVSSWRQQWGQGPFPFYFAQIAPFDYRNRANSAFLREAQLHTMETLANSGMAVLLDIGAEKVIHPPEKITVGERLAYWALAKNYGLTHLEYAGPIYRAMQPGKDGAVVLEFNHAPNGLSDFGRGLSGFTIAGADRVFHPAVATIEKPAGTVRVSSAAVPEPVAVRYAFENWVEATLFSVSGLPATSFRTDDWDK